MNSCKSVPFEGRGIELVHGDTLLRLNSSYGAILRIRVAIPPCAPSNLDFRFNC